MVTEFEESGKGQIQIFLKGGACSSMAECLPSMCKALGLSKKREKHLKYSSLT
jgi:hypothetical protein